MPGIQDFRFFDVSARATTEVCLTFSGSGHAHVSPGVQASRFPSWGLDRRTHATAGGRLNSVGTCCNSDDVPLLRRMGTWKYAARADALESVATQPSNS